MIAVLASFSATAKVPDIYKDAPEETLSVFSEVDQLVEQGKYLTAFGKLGTAGDNKYSLFKRVTFCTDYFAMSLMHQMFSFKDLEEGETLMEIRSKVSGQGGEDLSLSMVMFNPEEAVNSWVEENGPDPLMDLALANYYFDALMRYRDQWLKSWDELLPVISEKFQNAYQAGLWTQSTLGSYGDVLMYSEDWEKSVEIHELLTKEFPGVCSYVYSLALSYLQTGNWKGAEKYAEKYVKISDEIDDYIVDGYCLMFNALHNQNKTSKGIKKLEECCKRFPESPWAYYYLGDAYLQSKKQKEALSAYVNYYRNLQDINRLPEFLNGLLQNADADFAISYVNEILKIENDSLMNQCYLNYNLAQLYFYVKEDFQTALQVIQLSSEQAQQTQVQQLIDATSQMQQLIQEQCHN